MRKIRGICTPTANGKVIPLLYQLLNLRHYCQLSVRKLSQIALLPLNLPKLRWVDVREFSHFLINHSMHFTENHLRKLNGISKERF